MKTPFDALRAIPHTARRNLLGVVAIVIASSGTAVAATSVTDRVAGPHTQGIESADIAPGAVGSGKLATDSVRGRAVKESTLDPTVLQRRVDGACLVGETIRQINQDGSVLCQADATAATGAAGGDLAGSYPNPQIAGGAVSSEEVKNGSLVGDDIAADSLGGDQVNESLLSRAALLLSGDLSGSLADAHLTAGSVGSSEVADASITGADVAPNSLGGTQVDENSLAAGGDLTGTLANAEISPRTVGTAELGVLPAGRALQTGTPQSFANGVTTRVQLNSAALSQGVTFDDANDQFTVITPGVYAITAEMLWRTNNDGIRLLTVNTSAGEVAAETRTAVPNYATLTGVSTLVALSAGNVVYLNAAQNGAAALNSDITVDSTTGSSNRGASLTLTYVSPLVGVAGRPDGDQPLRKRYLD